MSALAGPAATFEVTSTPIGRADLRTPSQVALLIIATFGIYGLWWLGRRRWIAESACARKHRPIAAWVALPIPILGLFVYYGALDVINKGVRARFNPGPVPYWLYGLLGSNLTFPIIQSYIYHEALLESDGPKPKLSIMEIVTVAIGLGIWGDAAITSTNTDGPLSIIVLLLAAFVFYWLPFWFVTRRINKLVADSRLTPCHWCLALKPKAALVCQTCHRETAAN